MRALVVTPGRAGSARLGDVPEPPASEGPILLEMVATGVCGTDRELLRGDYGEAPPRASELILGHESLGRVLDAPAGGGIAPGDLVVGIVRHPDPVPCENCARGEWDMCRNGRYTERGIKGRNGFCSERFRLEPDHAVVVDRALGIRGVLVEPTSVVVKAWSHAEAIFGRAHVRPRCALVTGAGSIGLLAALVGVQRGLDVHVLDRVTEGPKPKLVAALGATYHPDFASVAARSRTFDLIFECTGASRLVLDAMKWVAPDGVACLIGLASPGRTLAVDVGALDRRIVLENAAIFGSVNAGRRHYVEAAAVLARADPDWLDGLLTRQLPLERWSETLERRPDDVKVVILGPGRPGHSSHPRPPVDPSAGAHARHNASRSASTSASVPPNQFSEVNAPARACDLPRSRGRPV